MLTVQNYQMSPKVSFKADDKNNKPFQTHAGLKTSAALATVGIVAGLIQDSQIDAQFRSLSNTAQGLKNNKWISIPLTLLGYAGIGALVDRAKNKENKKLSDDINQFGKTEALKINPKAEPTRNENLYNKSYTGVKVGVLASMAIWTITSLISGGKTFKGLLYSLPLYAIDGVGLGLLADICSNDAAKKHAEKQA